MTTKILEFATIELHDDHALVTMPVDGSLVTKQFTPETLAKIISQNINIDTGVLPPNTMRYTCNHNGIFVGIFSPSTVRNVLYRNRESDKLLRFQCPTPNSIFIMWFDKSEKLKQVFVFALKTNLLVDNSVIHQYPFGNVHKTGTICLGNALAGISINVANCGSVIDLFYNSPFNSDLDTNMVSSNENKIEFGQNTIEFFRIHDKKTEFPEKVLRKLDENLGDTWKDITMNLY